MMRVRCHPTVHEWLVYVLNHPIPWLVAEITRGLGPVVRIPVLGTVVNDPEVARLLMHEDDLFSKAGRGSIGALVTQVMGPSALINMDGAEHRALREKLRDLFSPSYVDALAHGAMTTPLDGLARDLGDGRTIDLVAFMRQFSSRVTCRMLGIDVPADRAAETYAEIHLFGEKLASQVRFSAREMSADHVARARVEFERLTAHARAAYASDSALTGSIIDRLRDLGLPFEAVQGILGAILVAGVQTVSVALPRIVALLLDSGEWSHLRHQPNLVCAAVDEGLRCTVPIPATIRSIAQTGTVRGHRFTAGGRAFIFTYNLAKDPRLFPSPERFDILRASGQLARYLWYGSGPHFAWALPSLSGSCVPL